MGIMVNRLSHNELSVGVVTLSGRFNYGNRLQCYATQQLLKSHGCAVETLEFTDLNPKRIIKRKIKSVLGANVEQSRVMKMSPERRNAFAEFQSLIQTRKVSQARPDFVSDYHYLATGSDQVWNPAFMSYKYPELLRFAPGEKRIALAASIGARELDEKHRRLFSKALCDFKCISVREENASRIVRELTGREPAVVIDPTLMLDSSIWGHIANNRLVPRGPYVFAYCLSSDSVEIQSFCETVRKAYHAESVVWVSDNDNNSQIPAGPTDFISLIANAEAVVTDSFHGSIFSVLFHKQFYIFKRNGMQDMFSRIETLVKQLSLQNQVVDAENSTCGSLLETPVDYVVTDDLLDGQRKLFNDFLSVCLR